jgi:hypothetical protein
MFQLLKQAITLSLPFSLSIFYSLLSSHSLLFKAYKKEAATSHYFTVTTLTFSSSLTPKDKGLREYKEFKS